MYPRRDTVLDTHDYVLDTHDNVLDTHDYVLDTLRPRHRGACLSAVMHTRVA